MISHDEFLILRRKAETAIPEMIGFRHFSRSSVPLGSGTSNAAGGHERFP